MPVLENPKHEEFALLLARGVKQGAAYVKAGYSENKGAASKLAQTPKVADRVEELRVEIARKVKTAMVAVTEENWKSLADMGLTLEWVAEQYQMIYEAALRTGNYAPANTAIQSIQKLIEMEKASKPNESREHENKISIKDTIELLREMKGILATAPEPQMVDITPQEIE